jgi:hypothetical protein
MTFELSKDSLFVSATLMALVRMGSTYTVSDLGTKIRVVSTDLPYARAFEFGVQTAAIMSLMTSLPETPDLGMMPGGKMDQP